MSIPGRPMPDSNTEYVKEAENIYKVQVKFVSRAKLHISVLVKGSEEYAGKVQDAARFLCFHMCGNVSFRNSMLKLNWIFIVFFVFSSKFPRAKFK